MDVVLLALAKEGAAVNTPLLIHGMRSPCVLQVIKK
jgi:hypothetical protein